MLDIVWIDQQRIGFELLSRTGKLAQDEHTVIIDAAGAIFLGYEVHSILERGDKSDVARAIVREKIFAIEAAKVILHREPRASGETPVDIAHEPINAAFELMVSWNLHPARHNHLDEHDAATQLRIAFESVAKCAQSFRNSLAVIEPVRSHDQLAIRECAAQLLRFLRNNFGPFDASAHWRMDA